MAAGALAGCTAVSFTVTTATDAPDANPGDGICDVGDGSCSLRAAIAEADLGPSYVATVDIAPGINPTLSIPPTGSNDIASGDLDVTKTLFLHGHGATIDGGRLDRVIRHLAGVLEADNLTITHGRSDGWGGGISSTGGLHLINVTVDDNEAHFASGGGISFSAPNGASTFVNVNVTNNVAIGYPGACCASGGGVSVWAGADASALVWHGGRISGNSAYYGAAIAGDSTTQDANALAFDHLTIADNVGFALAIGSATISDSSIYANAWSVFFGRGGPVNVVRSTIVPSGPFLTEPCSGGCSANLRITQSTVVGVDVYNGRGNIFEFANAPCPVAIDSPPPLYIDTDFNLHVNTACLPDQLGPLANNGGPTLTFNPTASSAAVDKIPVGTPGLCDESTPVDQRGVAVPQGHACDIGAVERTVSP